MVEQIKSAGDAAPSAGATALNIEHERTLRALQSEINYHRERDENGSYMDKAIKMITDSSASSLHNLEIAYDAEKEKPNSVSRESVIAAVKEDQDKMKNQNSIEWGLSGITSFGLFLAGGRWGKVLGTAAMSASAMHPSDSIGEQAVQGLFGIGQGMVASSAYNFGMKMRHPIGRPLALVSYPMIGASTRSVSHDRQADPPDTEKVYGEPLQLQPPPPEPPPRGPLEILVPSVANPSAPPNDSASAPPTNVRRAPADWYK